LAFSEKRIFLAPSKNPHNQERSDQHQNCIIKREVCLTRNALSQPVHRQPQGKEDRKDQNNWSQSLNGCINEGKDGFMVIDT